MYAMKKISWNITIPVAIIAVALVATCWIFGSAFAKKTVDWFAIFAGVFLAVEGTYKIAISKTPFFPDQLLRVWRITIGASVFTVHLLLLFTS